MYEIGKVYNTPKGDILILDRIPQQKHPDGRVKHHPRVIIKFIKTGTVISVQTSNIKYGKFEDYMEPTVYGVGFLGSPIRIPSRTSKSIVRAIYDLWANMLKRVYGSYKGKYSDCSVDPRWHNFTTFLNTISEVKGYDLWEKDHSYHLDKDELSDDDNRVYSRDTCQFVTGSYNTKLALDKRWHRK